MLRLILAVLTSRLAQSTAMFVLAVLTVATATAAPLYASAADTATVAAQIHAATPDEQAIALTSEVPAVDGYTAPLDELRGKVQAKVHDAALTQVSGAVVRARVGREGVAVSAPVATRSDVCAHLQMLEGDCSVGPGEVVVSLPTAKSVDAHVGSELVARANGSETPVTLQVTGIYDAVAGQRASDPYWAGRVDLTPQSLRITNPVFTGSEAIDGFGMKRVTAMVDLYVKGGLSPDSLARVAASAHRASRVSATAQVREGLSDLLTRIQSNREVLGMAIPLGTLRLPFVAWFVLLIAVAATATARRAELALVSLRGTPSRHRLLFLHGPTALLLLVAAPIGVAVGWLAVRAVSSLTFGLPGPVELGTPPLITAAGTLLALLATAVIAERRAVRGTVSDALRMAPPRASRAFGLVEIIALILAAIAVVQSVASPDQGGVLVLLAPLLVALAIGLLAARLVSPVAAAFAASRLHRGRVATAIAALHLARRPGADRIVALTVVVVSLVTYSACAWNVAAVEAQRQAELALGSPRVLTVSAASSGALRAAVERADPDGAWAMAATRAVGDRASSIGVDSPRLAATSLWPREATLSPSQAAAEIRPKIAEPVGVAGSGLELDVTVMRDLGSPMHVLAGLVGPSGESITTSVDIAPDAGPARYTMSLPACSTKPGCRLVWLSFPRSADDLHVTSLIQLNPQRTLLSGESISAASRWRSALGFESAVTVITGRAVDATAAAPATAGYAAAVKERPSDWVSLQYKRPPPGIPASTDIRLYVNDGPVPLPLVAAVSRLRAATDESTTDALPSMPGPVELTRESRVLPGVAASGALFDLEYADRIATDDDDVALEVWLGAAAPKNAVERLRAEGLQVLRDETVAERIAQYEQQGVGLAPRIELAAAALSVLLVVLGLLVLAATDRHSRARELAALRTQGVGAATVARAARLGNVALIAVAAPVGLLAAALSWALPGHAGFGAGSALPPAQPDPGVALTATILVTAVLLGAALLAGQALSRAAARNESTGANR